MGSQTVLEGVWEPTDYVQKDGSSLPVTGRIFFSGDEWTVLFFVIDEQSRPARGSAEGGTFTVNGKRLTFKHERNVSGPASGPIRLSLRSPSRAQAEECRFDIEDGVLRIHFPSGNRMDFRRVMESND